MVTPVNHYLRERVRLGVLEGKRDIEMSQELGVSRERIRQIRVRLSLPLPKCQCGSILKANIKIGICTKCKRGALDIRLCVICKNGRVVKPDDDRCWKCRRYDFDHSAEGRAYNNDRNKKYIRKIKEDPIKREKRKAQVKEWNRRAKERRMIITRDRNRLVIDDDINTDLLE